MHACQYKAGDSPIHRLGGGWKLALCAVMAGLALAAREPWALLALLFLNIFYYMLARLSFSDLWRDVRFLLIQMFIVILLYIARYGVVQGLWPGTRTGLQILLFFLPSAVMLRTTESSRMVKSLRKILPPNISFAVLTSLRFVPFFAREIKEIAAAQRLRGVPLSPRQMINPANWRYITVCLIMPLMVRALKTADEASMSAEARGYGKRLQKEAAQVSREAPMCSTALRSKPNENLHSH